MDQIFKYDCHEPAYRQADARISNYLNLLVPIRAFVEKKYYTKAKRHVWFNKV